VAGVKGQRSGGHNRKSRGDHARAGNLRADRHGAVDEFREPEPPVGDPVVPKDLPAEARAEWNRMVPRLRDMRTLSTVDDAVLARYCRLHARAWRLERALATEDVYLEKVTTKGKGANRTVVRERKLNPGFGQLRQHDNSLRQYLVEFGLTPASRGRVRIPDGSKNSPPIPGTVTPLEALQQRRRLTRVK
jgi:P27 family predicted phage terminase small subunit